MILLKRAYDVPSPEDGVRFLVDRLWPRGVTKAELRIDAWLKDAAPSNELRRTFHHDPDRWEEFERRYAAELAAHPEAWAPIADADRQGNVTLIYGAKDTERNNAVALKRYVQSHAAHIRPH